MNTTTTARVYVGTYAKYNDGNLTGKWLDLEDYSDKDEFMEACAELHADEKDPELMFQDFEGFPKRFYGESCIDEGVWEWLELEEDDRDLLEAYIDNMGEGTIKDARQAYMGTYRSKEEWAEDYLTDTGGLEGVPEHLKNYIDFESYARDAQLGGDVYFLEKGGEVIVFRNN